MSDMRLNLENLLARHGWEVVCQGPFEIRHPESGSFASGQAAQMVVEALEKEDAPLQEYENGSVPALRAAPWPLDVSLFEPFLDTGKMVTFTATIPLGTLVCSDVDGLRDYCEQAFASKTGVEMSHTEFRVIPGDGPSDSWNERFDGDVILQVTCMLCGND
jgi:hypothetical protein